MPLETRTLTLKGSDLQKRGDTVVIYNASYIPISQHGYGRMDANTPGNGFSTDNVVSCTVVVLHCPSTGRTTVSHSPNFLYMQTFLPLITWITNEAITAGPELDEPPSHEKSAGTPCHVEAVVMRGWQYATPLGETFGHEGWMSDFRAMFAYLTAGGKLTANITDSSRLLTAGAALVDKTTARITYIELGRGLTVPPLFLKVENPLMSTYFTDGQYNQVMFTAILLHVRHTAEPTSLYLQYNVNHYCLPPPLNDESRILLRSKRLQQPPASQSAIIGSFGQSEDWIALAEDPKFHLINAMFSRAVMTPVCELCPEYGVKACGACRGAWYCGHEHQKRHWREHKDWCKRNPFSGMK